MKVINTTKEQKNGKTTEEKKTQEKVTDHLIHELITTNNQYENNSIQHCIHCRANKYIILYNYQWIENTVCNTIANDCIKNLIVTK